MQLYAITTQGELINATEAKKHIDYVCLECGGIVRLRGGNYRQDHFYHLDPPSSCRLNQKSMRHLQVQWYLQKLFPTCYLEYRFKEINRIADVACPSEKIIFEVQCSPISEEILHRNKDYESLGWHVVWILHDYRYNNYRYSSAEAILRNYPHYFTNIDHTGKGEIYDQFDLIQTGVRHYKMSPLTVKLSAPFYTSHATSLSSTLKLGKERLRHWPLFFEGDLLYLSLYPEKLTQDQVNYLLHAQEKENFYKLSKQSSRENKKSLFEIWIKKIFAIYKFFFHFFLEKHCR